MEVSSVLTIHVYLSTYLVVTTWLTYLPTYVVTMVVKGKGKEFIIYSMFRV
jgi:hypothetical protein